MDRMHIIKEINMKIIICVGIYLILIKYLIIFYNNKREIIQKYFIIIIIILLPNLYRYSKVIILFRNKSKGGI